ncbi:class I SAM-dependent RNA methyltransferase [Propylenella binzhouense]|uniref:Class I SAM-dependent RNA methyltransferase n=1 Tax=Propylenella binzhouense TaxID=2555902 RepID=A0A964WSB6_9HYPH|nr:class I SAM-dependent RNA methyltransferase [Propylenella binzhouense]MYZ46792.1 class I SAM-dependent RNA methyltransferase [Propylenella binzhouense]
MAETVRVAALGHRGDGVAAGPEGALYVPFTLPGEEVRIERAGTRARLLEIMAPSPERVAPACPHFGLCGGCQLQMMSLDAARSLKRRFVADALAREGIGAEPAETIGVDPASRRRAALTAVKAGDRVLLGFNERNSNRLVDLERCVVLVPGIAGRLPAIRRLLAPLLAPRKPARVTVLATGTGLDIAVEGTARRGPGRLPHLLELAEAAGIARLSLDGEVLLGLAEPRLAVGGLDIVPPPGAFVQASAEAEAAMTRLVVRHLAGAGNVVDLFAGLGTFSLALARTARVTAVESAGPALDALAAAARRATGLKPIRTERRDLFAFPLAEGELARFDGAVFDPPRAGAKAQAALLARSTIGRIAAVSCNPASFARDARLLVDGGYRLETVVPVDQFVHSAEVEVVGLFVRT